MELVTLLTRLVRVFLISVSSLVLTGCIGPTISIIESNLGNNAVDRAISRQGGLGPKSVERGIGRALNDEMKLTKSTELKEYLLQHGANCRTDPAKNACRFDRHVVERISPQNYGATSDTTRISWEITIRWDRSPTVRNLSIQATQAFQVIPR